MSTPLQLTRDNTGQNAYGLMFPTNAYSASLNTETDTTLTVPSATQHWMAVFSISPGARVWVAKNTTAEMPPDPTFAATSSVLNPTARNVEAGDVLHFFTPDSSGVQIGVEFYAL